MPRRARSTLRAEIREGGSFGTSMELPVSASVVTVSADASPELLIMQNLRCLDANLMEFENAQPIFAVGLVI